MRSFTTVMHASAKPNIGVRRLGWAIRFWPARSIDDHLCTSLQPLRFPFEAVAIGLCKGRLQYQQHLQTFKHDRSIGQNNHTCLSAFGTMVANFLGYSVKRRMSTMFFSQANSILSSLHSERVSDSPMRLLLWSIVVSSSPFPWGETRHRSVGSVNVDCYHLVVCCLCQAVIGNTFPIWIQFGNVFPINEW